MKRLLSTIIAVSRLAMTTASVAQLGQVGEQMGRPRRALCRQDGQDRQNAAQHQGHSRVLGGQIGHLGQAGCVQVRDYAGASVPDHGTDIRQIR
jgi:Ni/Co efflux regulator RcnB